MTNVVQIEALRITRESKRFVPKACQHTNLTMDEHGHCVKCDDCGANLSAYWVLEMFCEQYEKAMRRVETRAGVVAAAEAKTLVLRAAQTVEAAWRSRTMVPTCPHCREPIFAADGFGRAQINKEFAERRRAEKAKP